MRYVVIVHDAVQPATMDPAVVKRHFDFLQANADKILLAGGLRDDADQPFVGAMWIVEAPSRSEALALFAADPFTLEGHWSNHSVFAWNKSSFYGPVTL
jgi:uncharacterized protein YciI